MIKEDKILKILNDSDLYGDHRTAIPGILSLLKEEYNQAIEDANKVILNDGFSDYSTNEEVLKLKKT